MSLQVAKDNNVWTVFFGQQAVAEIHLDFECQLDKVLLYTEVSSEIQLEVLQLAASHAQKFVRERRITAWGGLLVAEYGNKNLRPVDSDRLMHLQEVSPEIKQLDRETIVRELGHLKIEVSTAIHKTADEAIKDARADYKEKCLSASWSRTKHPYHAIGSTVQMKLIVASLRSNEGVEELVQALRASLGLEKLYICISGGFRAPFTAITNDRKTRDNLRGSESSCVWEYLTLKEEGALKESYIPAWFIREGWLTKYRAS